MTTPPSDIDIARSSAFVSDVRRSAGVVNIVPSEAGWRLLRESGKAGWLSALVGSRLAETELAGWRIVRRLPNQAGGAKPRKDPTWSIVERAEGLLVASTTISEDLFVLEGHFPDEPIVPGVAQVVWITRLVREVFAPWQPTGELEALKFKQVIQPGDRVEASIRLDATSARAAFVCRSEARVFSSGRLCLERAHA